MRKIKVFAIALALVLGLSAGIFAIGKLATKSFAKSEAASCCRANHSGQTAATENGKESCCAGGTCKMGGSCCSGGHCSMKKSGEQASAVSTEEAGKMCNHKMSQQTAETGENCCTAGASCCNGGACCKAKSETAKL